MDFNAWQRSQKKAEQRNKNQSKALYRSYQGGLSEIDKKIADQKKQQKEKENEIAAMNKSYKGGLTEMDQKIAELRGANAVVLKDVPAHATMVGNPVKNISINKDTSFKPYGVRDIDDNE